MKITVTHTASLAATGCFALYVLARMFAQPPGLLLFSADGSGRGQGAILHAGTALLADRAHPVKAGDPLEIYVTGLPESLEECPAVRACEATGVEVTIGEMAAPILYLGRPPQLSHRSQLNVRVPEGVAVGASVPVRVRAAEKLGNQVTIAIH